MNVVLAPHGTRGDVQPMVALALALRARAHSVSIVAPNEYVAWIGSFGIAAYPNGIDLEQRDAGPEHDRASWSRRIQQMVSLVPLQFATLLPRCEGADVIVAAGVHTAAASVAERMRVPYVTAVFAPCAVPGGHAPPPFVRSQRCPSFVNRVRWAVRLAVVDALFRRAINDERLRLNLPRVSRPSDLVNGNPMLLAASRWLAPLPRTAAGKVVTTGPWILPSAGRIDATLAAFLDAGPRPVYLGFGSTALIRKPDQRVVEMAIAAASRAGVRLLIDLGTPEPVAPASLPGWCCPVAGISHDVLFRRLAAVVHHGGAGTTTAAARAGVPQLVVPHWYDQFYWGRRVEVLGIGPRSLPIASVTERRLAKRLELLVSDQTIASRARSLASKLRDDNGTFAAVRALENMHARAAARTRENPLVFSGGGVTR